MMEQRIFQGTLDPVQVAQYLLDTWDQEDTLAQALEGDDGLIVQIGQRTGGFFNDEPRNALTLALEPVSDGLRVTMAEQQWYRDGGGQLMVGGLIGFFPFFFTWPLGGGGRDEPIDAHLAAQVWDTIDQYVRTAGAVTGETTRLPRTAATGETTRLPSTAATGETTRLSGERCPTCGTPNAPGTERCQACGTFLQARDCPQCGVSNPATANFCMRCGTNLNAARTVND
ncbi:MAG TPA: zinc ribbon domain-containing protein [Roseiflexaceae bacterium]|jgi:hypothetical protein|nr:zinc ribbon domain-containing protein [Roseiflexaceae bacterium]